MYDGSVLADLAAVIEDLDIPFDGESLEQAIALRDRARRSHRSGHRDLRGQRHQGRRRLGVLVAWLRAHANLTRTSAQRLRTLAVRLRALPVCAQAYADGSLPEARSRLFSPGSTTRSSRYSPLRKRSWRREPGPGVLAGPEPARAHRAQGAGADAACVAHPRRPVDPRRGARCRRRLDRGHRAAVGHARQHRSSDQSCDPAGQRPGRHLPVLPRPPAHPRRPPAPAARQRDRRAQGPRGRPGGQVVDGPALDGATVSRLSATAPCTG